MSDPIPLSEAARLVGKTPGALRRLVNEGRLHGHKDVQGRHLVHREEVIAHYAITLRSGASADRDEDRSDPRSGDPLLQALRDQVAILRSTVDQDRIEKAELRTQNKELQGEILKLNAEMLAMLKGEGKGLLSRWMRK
ncbi:MAG: hypothetical protein ACK5OA_15040 [Acidovorax sp.]|jgi:hypothetical protein